MKKDYWLYGLAIVAGTVVVRKKGDILNFRGRPPDFRGKKTRVPP